MQSILAMEVHKRSLRLNYYRRFKFGFCPDFFEKKCKLLDWKGKNGEIGAFGVENDDAALVEFLDEGDCKKN